MTKWIVVGISGAVASGISFYTGYVVGRNTERKKFEEFAKSDTSTKTDEARPTP